jgi:hypothetical protein
MKTSSKAATSNHKFTAFDRFIERCSSNRNAMLNGQAVKPERGGKEVSLVAYLILPSAVASRLQARIKAGEHIDEVLNAAVRI